MIAVSIQASPGSFLERSMIVIDFLGAFVSNNPVSK